MQWLASIFAKPLLDKLFKLAGQFITKFFFEIGKLIEDKKRQSKNKKKVKEYKNAKDKDSARDAFNKLP